MTMSARTWLVLRLEAPLLSFGAVAIDQRGVIWDFPALSMLTGLFANALGWERTQRAEHQALQDRLVFASRREDEPYHGVFTDVQNAEMEKSDSGWTTRGTPEGRDGGSYGGPHRRFRDYHPDALVSVVVSLAQPTCTSPAGAFSPVLGDLAAALDRPERPLFIGRKPCLPTANLNAGFIQAETGHEAISSLAPASAGHTAKAPYRAQWPAGEGPTSGPQVDRGIALPDRRNWISGLHGGTRHVIEGRVTAGPVQPQRLP
jgi:CRISPR system Cascade subunit CasD